MDEVLLIQECLKGKRKAQGELYRRYAAKMMGVCMRYSRNRDMAHDLLQEGFIKVFTNLNEYSGNGSFEGWMRKIFINCALEKIRRSKVFPLTFPTEETEQETSFPNALEEISAQEMLDLIHRLPPGYQTIFNLFAIEGFSHKEIGAMLRITEGTSRSQYARARYTLQQMIKNLYRLWIEETDLKNCSGNGCIIGNVNRIQNNGKPSLVFFLYDLPGFPPDPYAGRQLS